MENLGIFVVNVSCFLLSGFVVFCIAGVIKEKAKYYRGANKRSNDLLFGCALLLFFIVGMIVCLYSWEIQKKELFFSIVMTIISMIVLFIVGINKSFVLARKAKKASKYGAYGEFFVGYPTVNYDGDWYYKGQFKEYSTGLMMNAYIKGDYGQGRSLEAKIIEKKDGWIIVKEC